MLYGRIIKIIPGKIASYQVRLENRLTVVIFSHDLITPTPSKVLRIGSRVALQMNGDKVEWATTDLSSGKQETTGSQRTPESSKQSHSEQPVRELVTIVSVNHEAAEVLVQRAEARQLRMRLPRESNVWARLQAGKDYALEIKARPDGSQSYTLLVPFDQPKEETPAAPKEPDKRTAADKKTPAAYESPVAKEEASSTQEQASGNKQPPPEDEEEEEVHRIGLDRDYFYERKSEGHRHEIMAFIENHLDDELIEWYKMLPQRDARFRNPAHPLATPVAKALQTADDRFQKFYWHQAEALDTVRAGKNVVIITQTASGKTLCYNPVIFEHFVKTNPSACALYIFPLNALLMDQKEKIDALTKQLAVQGIRVRAEILKGGLGTEKRHQLAQKPPHILAINPELLSVILNEYDQWQEFFRNLKYVVIDEVHAYRGPFGMHVAGILRRLLLATRRLNNEPQFILSSATVNNPMQLATNLTSLSPDSFHFINEASDGSFQANKHWLVLNPDAYHDGNGYDNHLYTAAFAMIELLTSTGTQGQPSPLNTILFAKSIRDVKKIYTIIQTNVRPNHPELAKRIRHYTAADLSETEKREIYNGLKTGEIVGVISTNALEAGIDIGKLDACVITGFPYWVMRLRQMAGRVGRQQEGLVIFIPHPSRALDQYYRAEPDLLHTQPPEAFVVDPENPYIARKHIHAAAYSMKGLSEQELKIFGERTRSNVDQAIADGVIWKNNNVYFGKYIHFKNSEDTYLVNHLRSGEQIPYVVCEESSGQICQPESGCYDTNSGKKCSARVTVLDQLYAYRDCHIGAIYEAMNGHLYQAVNFDDARKVIRVTKLPDGSLERTAVEQSIDIQILGEHQRRSLPGGAILHLGDVKVTRSFSGYREFSLEPIRRCRRCKVEVDGDATHCPRCHRKTSSTFKQSKSSIKQFPEPHTARGFHITLVTIACWLTIPAEMEGALWDASPCKLPGVENRQIALFQDSVELNAALGSYNLEIEKQEKLQKRAHEITRAIKNAKKKASQKRLVLFPGVYGQCFLHELRNTVPESQAQEIYQRLTGYPITGETNHICRKCMSSTLLPAMHTIEHTVSMRYPSVALGDPTDLGSQTTLGHPQTQSPTIFWYDNYQGGMGASDKLYDRIEELFEASIHTLTDCSCSTIEGCPNCTQIGSCDRNNEGLSKPAALMLLSALMGRTYSIPIQPHIYSKSAQDEFANQYQNNEYSHKAPSNGGKETTQQGNGGFDPFEILRIQKKVHECVLSKAYSIRGEEIMNETPIVSAVELNQAYQAMIKSRLETTWQINPTQSAYQRMEILPSASYRMVTQVYRAILMQIHPDHNRDNLGRANEMTKLINEAYNEISDEIRSRSNGKKR